MGNLPAEGAFVKAESLLPAIGSRAFGIFWVQSRGSMLTLRPMRTHIPQEDIGGRGAREAGLAPANCLYVLILSGAQAPRVKHVLLK